MKTYLDPLTLIFNFQFHARTNFPFSSKIVNIFFKIIEAWFTRAREWDFFADEKTKQKKMSGEVETSV